MNLFRFITRLLPFIAALAPDLHANIKMGIITSFGYVGDREAAWRIKIAAERLGWTVFLDEREGEQLKSQEVDFAICMLPNRKILNPSYPNYLMVFHPFNYLRGSRRFTREHEKYDGYLLTINDRKTLKKGLKKKNKKFHYTSFYPTVYRVPYQRLALNNLVVMIPVWSNRLHDPKFGELYRLLSQSGFTKFYGGSLNENVDPQNYMGPFPFDGISILDILQRHGIVFVFHSEIHNQEGIPSSRIFEAAAASTVIICDENAFVKKHFGDSIFYIDTSETGENIFRQIQEHIHTIFTDPEKALLMAQKANEIFNEKFTMENQLINLQHMHQEVLKNRK